MTAQLVEGKRKTLPLRFAFLPGYPDQDQELLLR
jgi:hypothetical protein